VRLLELHLLRFGALEDVALALEAPGLHVVHGGNGVGKSTLLRAVGDLLFGIPATTPDAHRFRGRDLRIRACVQPPGTPGAAPLWIQRRKGRKNTLLDDAGQPFDETRLAGWLGGVTREGFERQYGLSHASLLEGGRALARGEGDLGESLFGAATGLPGLHRLREQLAEEAGALYRERGQNPELNAALRRHRDERDAARRLGLRPRDWLELDERRREVSAELARASAEGRRAVAERERLARVVRVLGRVRRRERLRGEVEKLGEVPELPTNAGAEIERLRGSREDRTVALDRVEADLVRAEQALADVPDPAPWLAHEKRLEALARSLARAEAAREDERDAAARIDALAREIDLALRELGGAPGAGPGALPELDAGLAGRLRALVRERTRLDERAQEAARDRLRVARESGSPPPVAEPPDLRELAAALRDARPHAGLERECDERAEQLAALDERLARRCAALPGTALELEALCALAVPSAESVAEEARALAQAEREADRLRQARAAELEAAERARRRIARLEGAGAVPSPDGVAAAREDRDAAWRALRDDWTAGRPAEPAVLDGYEGSVRAADTAADRLRDDAERAAAHTAARSERQRAEERAAAHAGALEALEARRAAQEAAWRARWLELGVAADAPEVMRGWLEELASLRAGAEERDELRRRQAGRRRALERCRARLACALAPLADPAPARDAGLDALLAAAERALEDGERARDAWERACEQAESLAERERALEEREARLAADESEWRAQWQPALQALGLRPDAGVEEVEAWLEAHGRLRSRALELEQCRRGRAERVEELAAFAREVEALAALFEAGPASADPHLAAADLLDRLADARRRQARRDELVARRDDLRRRRDELATEREQAEARIRAWVERARCGSEAELDGVVARVERAHALSEEQRTLDASLSDEGLPLAELVAEALAADPEELPVLQAAAADEAEAVEARCNALREERGRLEARLDALDGAPVAADAAAAAAAELAAIAEGAERYAELVAERWLLEREIDRYRESHQGPLLRAASAGFASLTLGAWSGLTTQIGEDDRQRIAAVRPDGAEVPVTGLSSGTRDQLYLALRLASLERPGERGPDLPIVLDDVFVQFDDARTRAGLELLAGLAERRQVVLFTHHDRVVELASEAGEAVHVQHLTGRTGVGAG